MPARYLQELLCKGSEYHWRPQVTYTHGQWNVVLPHGPWSPQSHLALCKSEKNNSGTYNVLKIRLLRGRVSSHTCSSQWSHIQLDQEVLTALKLIACWCWRLWLLQLTSQMLMELLSIQWWSLQYVPYLELQLTGVSPKKLTVWLQC